MYMHIYALGCFTPTTMWQSGEECCSLVSICRLATSSTSANYTSHSPWRRRHSKSRGSIMQPTSIALHHDVSALVDRALSWRQCVGRSRFIMTSVRWASHRRDWGSRYQGTWTVRPWRWASTWPTSDSTCSSSRSTSTSCRTTTTRRCWCQHTALSPLLPVNSGQSNTVSRARRSTHTVHLQQASVYTHCLICGYGSNMYMYQ